MKDHTLPIVIIGSIVALIAFIIWLLWYLAKRRREAWMAAADRLGFEYRRKDPGVLAEFGFFKLFQQGHSRKAYNILRGRIREGQVTLGDYRYTTGHGKHQQVHVQSICVLRSKDIHLPHCFLRKQMRVFDFLGKLFGGQDINFDEDPEFSKAFVLQGADELATRQAFHTEARQWFLRYRGQPVQLECLNDCILFHRGRTIKPELARELIDEVTQIFHLWA